MQRSTGLRGNHNYILLFGGRSFSELGDYFGELAISWLVYTSTGSVLSLGATWIFFLIPRSAVRLWGGVYVDRFNKRQLMILTEITRAAIFGMLAVAVFVGVASTPLVYVVSLLIGLIGAIFDIASQAIVPQLVEPAGLMAANSYMSASFQIGGILGPALAGVAIYVVGVGWSLSVDSVSFVALVLALAMIKLPREAEGPSRKKNWGSDFRQGWDYFWSKAELVWLSLLVGGLNFGLGGFWYVYALVLAKDVLNSGSAGFGALNSFAAIGIFATSAYLGRRGLRRRRLAVIFSMIVVGISVSLTSFAQNLPEALAATAAFGSAIPLISVVQSTYYQRVVPRDLMGRVFGLQQFFDYVSIPVGIVFAIFADTLVGVRSGILVSGFMIVVFGFAAVFARTLKKIDSGPDVITSQNQGRA